MLEVTSDDLYIREPHAILETFLLYERTVGISGLSTRTLRALYNVRNVMDARFRRMMLYFTQRKIPYYGTGCAMFFVPICIAAMKPGCRLSASGGSH